MQPPDAPLARIVEGGSWVSSVQLQTMEPISREGQA